MTYRQYRDDQDVHWQVWDIHPVEIARQLRATGDTSGAGQSTPAPRTRMAVSGELVAGWLCFESPTERRRLWPIPSGWEQLTDRELQALCAGAARTPQRQPRGAPRW